MDRTIGKSQNRNYDGERLMKILKSYKRMMAEFINEANESVKVGGLNERAWTPAQEKAVKELNKKHQKLIAKKGIEPYSYEASQLWTIGGFKKEMRKIFGKDVKEGVNEADVDDEKIIKYKTKDGEPGEMKAGSAKTMPKDHPAKISYDKMQDDGGDSEKDSGGKLGGGDFDRDSGVSGDFDGDGDVDADDDDYETAEEKSEKENSQIGKDLNAMEGDLNGLGIDFLDSAIDDGMYAVLVDPESEGEPDKEMAVNAFPDGEGVGYAVNIGSGHKMIYFDSKEKMLDAAKKLVNDDRIRKSMDKDGKEDLADLGDYAESLLKGKDETKVINGVKYKPIKESKKHPLKENYDRIFRSRK